MSAAPISGTVVNRLGDPCPAASWASYPLFAYCEHCDGIINCADGTADWTHGNSTVCPNPEVLR